MNTSNNLCDYINLFLKKNMDLYSYFEFIYDLCELLLEFNIKVNRNSF